MLHQPFVFHLFVRRMLVHDKKLVGEGNQPVGIENLSQNAVLWAVLLCKHLFLKEVQLLRGLSLHSRRCLFCICRHCCAGCGWCHSAGG